MSAPLVMFLAAGYKLPAGIEAYLLHYATEMRRRGYRTRIVVFEPLPRLEHRFLRALRERGIPIESLYRAVDWRARALTALLWLPWRIRIRAEGGNLRAEEGTPVSGFKPHPSDFRFPVSYLHRHFLKRLAVRLLRRLIACARPDIIHVKGRIITEALSVLPSDRTLYQHALMGTRDPSWTDTEAGAFGVFLNRIAAVLVQGASIARTFADAFDIRRDIDVVYSMAPDEFDEESRKQTAETAESRKQKAENRNLIQESLVAGGANGVRFGIVCRFTEQKGIAYILEALTRLKARGHEVPFLFAGQGPLEPEIKAFAKTHGLSRVMVEPVTTAMESLRKMDVFVHPGLDDAMPVSIVEALMCGVPVIGSNVGATPELVRDGVEGLIVPPADAAAILAAMERFLYMSASERQAFDERARQRYESCCKPEVIGAQVDAIYRRIITAAEAKRV